jgi:16S rRNA (guanine966-N2)-methyltransferase
MKDRTREAVMSLLGGSFENSIAFDLFGGTGILAFETISRGAAKGVVFEILKSAVREIRTNAEALGIEGRVEIFQTDVLVWSESMLHAGSSEKVCEELGIAIDVPWVVYCCPPYALWDTDGQRLHDILKAWWHASPVGSLFAVELEERTPREYLPKDVEWDIRIYKPARMAIGEKDA